MLFYYSRSVSDSNSSYAIMFTLIPLDKGTSPLIPPAMGITTVLLQVWL